MTGSVVLNPNTLGWPALKTEGEKNKGDRLIKSVKEYLEVLEELQDKVALALLIFRSKANDPSSLILVEEIRQFHDYLIKAYRFNTKTSDSWGNYSP